MSKSKEPPFSAEYLRSILDYDPDTGEFRWKWRDDLTLVWNAKWPGTVAGSKFTGDHSNIYINKRPYKAHRLAWLHVYGEWPPHLIDHRNRDKLDNRIANLRLADWTQNAMNRGLQGNNSSGHAGVVWDEARQKWQAKISISKKWHCKRFKTYDEALAYRQRCEIEKFGEWRSGA